MIQEVDTLLARGGNFKILHNRKKDMRTIHLDINAKTPNPNRVQPHLIIGIVFSYLLLNAFIISLFIPEFFGAFLLFSRLIILFVVITIIKIVKSAKRTSRGIKRHKINYLAQCAFTKDNLQITKIIELYDKTSEQKLRKTCVSLNQLILVDERQGLIGLIDYANTCLYIVKYTDIINCNIAENKVGSNCDLLALTIFTNETALPQFTYTVIDRGTATNRAVLFNKYKASVEYAYQTLRYRTCVYCGSLNDYYNKKCTSCGAPLNPL